MHLPISAFPFPPLSMSYGAMHVGSPLGFGMMGFPMNKFYNPMLNRFVIKPFPMSPHMAMGHHHHPLMFNRPPMHMMPPPIAPMGFGHMGHMGGMGPRPMGMGMGPGMGMSIGMGMGMGMGIGMGFPPRYPPRRMAQGRPVYPAMRRRHFPRPPTRTPTAYLSSRGPATSYRPTYRPRTYQNTQPRQYSRYTQSYSRPHVVHSALPVARTPAVWKDIELDEDDKHAVFYNRFDTGDDFLHMQSPYAKSRGDYYKELSDEFKL